MWIDESGRAFFVKKKSTEVTFSELFKGGREGSGGWKLSVYCRLQGEAITVCVMLAKS